jgi:BlaI family transcriptional regulator, penicillinase repressor
MKKLTKTEEEIMQMFWLSGPSIVSELIEKMPDPKPPHSTVSSIVRILEKKGFLKHKAYGKTYEYSPVVNKDDYSKMTVKDVISNYFEGSPNALFSFLVKEEKVNIEELKDMLNKLENNNQK